MKVVCSEREWSGNAIGTRLIELGHEVRAVGSRQAGGEKAVQWRGGRPATPRQLGPPPVILATDRDSLAEQQIQRAVH